jgi:hypothetical protein
MIEITAPAPLPRGQRLGLKLLKLIGCVAAFCIGCKMFDVGIAKLSGNLLEAWEEKFLFFSTTLCFFFTYVAWKTRDVNGMLRVIGFLALAVCTLAALTNYEWRWFAHATSVVLGMFTIFVSLGITFSILETRA